jgi:hypothetical protein
MVHPVRKPPIWEKTKKEKRKNRLLKFFFLIILLIVAANLLVRGSALIKELNRPFARSPGDNKKIAELNFSYRTNLLLVNYEEDYWLNDIAIVSYEPGDRRLSVLLFDLTKNKSLQKSARSAFRKQGIDGLQRFVGNSLGVTIDRYLALKSDNPAFNPEDFLQVKKQLESPFIFFKVFSLKQQMSPLLQTNSTSSDLLKILWRIRSANFEEKDIMHLPKLGEEGLAGEKTISLVSNLFLDRKVLDEGASFTIRNSSGKKGLGNTLEQYLTNLGATVVTVESSEETKSETLLFVRNSKPVAEKRLLSIITFKKKGEEGEKFSGDMLVVLGADSTSELTLP